MNDEQVPDLQPQSPGGTPQDAVRAAAGVPNGSLDAVLELQLPVSIELGRTRMSVQDVLALGRGSVVQLDRMVGQPVDVYVGERRFATGKVVVTGEKFGVRILQINQPVAVDGAGN